MTLRNIPVILDTDIGDDIDDTWALAMMLKSPELDVKMVATDTGNTLYRAKIVAKMLEIAGRTDVPVAVGIHQTEKQGPQTSWVEDYDLSAYPGMMHEDGVQAMVALIMNSSEPITLIAIGPMPNIAKALDMEPGIAERTRFVGMHGSIRRSNVELEMEQGQKGPIAEYNVAKDVPACRKVFAAPWQSVTVTPLDTCGWVRLTGKKYAAVRDCEEPLTRAVIENYRIWLGCKSVADADEQSSILFDTVAVHLAHSSEFLVMEEMGVRVTNDGFTVKDHDAKRMIVAVEWEDLAAYEDYLVERLVGAEMP